MYKYEYRRFAQAMKGTVHLLGAALLAVLMSAAPAAVAQSARSLQIYFVDVGGGAAISQQPPSTAKTSSNRISIRFADSRAYQEGAEVELKAAFLQRSVFRNARGDGDASIFVTLTNIVGHDCGKDPVPKPDTDFALSWLASEAFEKKDGPDATRLYRALFSGQWAKSGQRPALLWFVGAPEGIPQLFPNQPLEVNSLTIPRPKLTMVPKESSEAKPQLVWWFEQIADLTLYHRSAYLYRYHGQWWSPDNFLMLVQAGGETTASFKYADSKVSTEGRVDLTICRDVEEYKLGRQKHR